MAGGARWDRAYRAGVDAALDAVVGTGALLLWPGDHTWVDPETVTSLIEAHGARPDDAAPPDARRAAGLAGARARIDVVDEVTSTLGGAGAAGAFDRVPLDLGDPGTVVTLAVAIDDVPDYVGPAAPVAGPPPDWGAAAADEPDSEVAVADEPD